jgi:hypothetical protein
MAQKKEKIPTGAHLAVMMKNKINKRLPQRSKSPKKSKKWKRRMNSANSFKYRAQLRTIGRTQSTIVTYYPQIVSLEKVIVIYRSRILTLPEISLFLTSSIECVYNLP